MDLLALQKEFKHHLTGKLSSMDYLWASFTMSGDYGSLNELVRLSHNLSGAGGTFGAIAISAIARKLEMKLKEVQSSVLKNDVVFNDISLLLQKLTEQSIHWVPSAIPYLPPVKRIESGNDNNLIYLAEDDDFFARELIIHLEKQHYIVKHFAELNDFEQAFDYEVPAAIIMDIVFKESDMAGADVIQRLNKKLDTCPPVIFISVRDDIRSRLAAARAGARRYFCKPINIQKLTQTLGGLTKRINSRPFQVLLVDDDEDLLSYYTLVLRDAGMEVRALSDPMEALIALNETKPDIIVLDVYMPSCTGPELAQVIRQDDEWALTPIMFLSSESDLSRQLAAMNLGGDDFLVKPVDPEHLVAAIIARAKRARWTNRLHGDLLSTVRENEFQLVTMNQHNIVSVADVAGKIISVNNKFCEISGYSRETLLGSDFCMIKSSYHNKAFYHDMWEQISTGSVWQGVICSKNKKDDVYWLDSTIVPFLNELGKPYKFVTIQTDITESKETELCLKESEERFSFAVEGAGGGVWDWDMSTNNVQLSRLWLEMLGYEINAFPHKLDTFKRLVHPEDMLNVEKHFRNYVRGESAYYSIELRMLCKNKTYKWILSRGKIMSRDDDGKPLRMVGINTDISQSKVVEFALVEAQKNAERANKVKSQFLSNMSHELRTPMNAIMGYGQLLKMDSEYPLNENQLESVDEVLKASQHLLSLIDEVLDLAKIEAGHIDITSEALLLGQIIQESVSIIMPLAQERGIHISLNYEDDTIALDQVVHEFGLVQADRKRLKQVFINLLSNAIKYNAENGTIIISCNKVDNNMIRISVSDTGKGLTEDMQARLFSSFERLDAEGSSVKGTGIGLVITKNIVELMGGNIGVTCEENEGCVFWVELKEAIPHIVMH